MRLCHTGLAGLLGSLALAAALGACNDGAPFARAYEIRDRATAIGGPSALTDVGDFVLENDQIRLGLPKRGNSTGPGVFGGSLIDADLQRSDPAHRAGRGLDQFAEMFPVGNLAIPAACQSGPGKIDEFCERLPKGVTPSVRVLCDGQTPCRTCSGRQDCAQRRGQIDLERLENADYADPADPTQPGPAAPGEAAAVVRVEGQAGNYLEALGLVAIANVKMSFRFRNDYILEPGSRVVRVRTMLTEANPIDGGVLRPAGRLVQMPALTEPLALFGILLGSRFFPTELEDMDPGVAGGDFLYFGDRLSIFAPGIGFDVYRNMREKFAIGADPINNPVAADYLAGVGEHVSYAVASADAGGKYLLPIFSGAVTAGFTHGAHCASACGGTPEQCARVVDCSQVRSFVFERLFAVGDGDVASAAAPILAARGVPLGRVTGRVVDGRDGQPVSGAEVHVYPVPATLAECHPGGSPLTAWTLGAEDFVALCLEPRSHQGAVSHLRTDRRATDLPAGAFDGLLPPGSYYLLAKAHGRPVSRVARVDVAADGSAEALLTLEPPARVAFEVLDEQNQRVPAKLLLGQCLPDCAGRLEEECAGDEECASGKCEDAPGGARRCLIDSCPAGRACDLGSHRCTARAGCREDSQCDLTERCLKSPVETEGRCVCTPGVHRQPALAEGSYPAGIARYEYAPTGAGVIEIEAGAYDVWASRGMEYSLDRQQVQVRPGRETHLTFRLRREVDTAGWMSGDFHVHGVNSYDATVKHRDRVAGFAGEGVEILSTSDHDYITDLAPYARDMGLEPWVHAQVGLELTTVEIGHWVSFPVRYEEFRDGERVREQGAIDWTGKVPEQLHTELRALGRFPPEETVVLVAHPRDAFFGYFDQYGLNAYDPSRVEGSLFEYLPPIHVNPLGTPEQFSGTFDALELFNSKRFELIRTPSAGEVRDYNLARKAVQAMAAQGASTEVLEAELIAVDRAYIKEMLRRTPAEQEALWAADGEGDCELYTFCSADSDCDPDTGERCDRAGMRCALPCAGPEDCDGRACQGGFCVAALTPADQPCTKHEGVFDDWLRLLDYGVVRTGMGDSDSHALFTQTEGGLPRNWVRLEAESPAAVDERALARAIRAGRVVTSYGPFVQVWLGDEEVGGTYSPPDGATSAPLRVRVQSPGWFDVDRVEIYRSGHLAHVLTGAGDELDPDSRVDVSGLRVPNPRVVNLDAVFDEPVGAEDTWYVVVAMGLEGRDLSPVYSAHPYLKLEIGDILSRALTSVPLPMEIDSAAVPRVFRVYPYAVANPVFLDADGDGRYSAPHPEPAWAHGPLAGRSAPLSSARIGGSPLAAAASAGEQLRARQLRHFMALFARAFRAP
ncbi:MAG TPA: hypothetical protein PK668_15065 [Myxococcota bacterium]|nr:hypothetical protein [Myxococcota bacterium]HRY94214.1 hypothetical protein [Myxococcota bacterium]HSA20100.1 hypothetical protein [Myxococcota bacterium]